MNRAGTELKFNNFFTGWARAQAQALKLTFLLIETELFKTFLLYLYIKDLRIQDKTKSSIKANDKLRSKLHINL